MSREVHLYFMIDAYGWEIYRRYPILTNVLGAQSLTSVFGYSSACIPSILSGRMPAETGNWCYYYYDPEGSPFRFLNRWKHIPGCVANRRRVRNLASRMVRSRLGLTGYFDLYNMPFDEIGNFDFSEKRSPLSPGGMNHGSSIIDELAASSANYFVSNPQFTESQNYLALLDLCRQGDLDFAFCYWPGLDGLMHGCGNRHDRIPRRLVQYERWILEIMAAVYRQGAVPRLHVFSDHGMANLKASLHPDSISGGRSSAICGRDYFRVVDSTMIRFWYQSDAVRNDIEGSLKTSPYGRIISDDELRKLGTFFPDYKFGETIFLLREGYQFAPSHMGVRAMAGMHGYHPDEVHSNACLLSDSRTRASHCERITDIYTLMSNSLDEIELRRGGCEPAVTAPDPVTA